MEQPDARKHLIISLVKSAVRILAGISLISGAFVLAGLLIIGAEVLGVAEELV